MKTKGQLSGFKVKLYEVIFEAETFAGKMFDIVLLACILTSVGVVILESIAPIQDRYGPLLQVFEWFFTILFTIEYLARLWVVSRKRKYVTSFFGIIDLLSILPTYLTFFLGGSPSLMVIRSLRLLRIFRIFKLSRYVGEGQYLGRALKASQHKIIVFLADALYCKYYSGRS